MPDTVQVGFISMAVAVAVGDHSPVSLCGSNMQRCDPDHLFFPTLALSESIMSNLAEPLGLFSPVGCKLNVERKKRRDTERLGQGKKIVDAGVEIQ